MKRFTICASLFVGGLAAAPASAHGDSGFCTDLKAVLADVRNDFATLRGAQLGDAERDSVNDVSTKYATSRMLTGATSCWVEDFMGPNDDKPLKSYNCDWVPPGTKIDTAEKVAQAAEDCVGNSSMDSMDVGDNDTADATIYGRSYKINIGAGTAPNVSLTIYDEN